MDLKTQIITEYLTRGCGFRELAAKYGINCTTFYKWVQIYQGIHGQWYGDFTNNRLPIAIGIGPYLTGISKISKQNYAPAFSGRIHPGTDSANRKTAAPYYNLLILTLCVT